MQKMAVASELAAQTRRVVARELNADKLQALFGVLAERAGADHVPRIECQILSSGSTGPMRGISHRNILAVFLFEEFKLLFWRFSAAS